VTPETYQQLFPDDGAWQPALRAICERHGLPTSKLVRASKGSHVVFYVGESLVIKLFAPLWLPDYEAESVALRAVRGRLPITAPEIIFEGEVEGWPYLVMQRLSGEPLVDCLSKLDPSEWNAIATQIGELAAALHAVPIAAASSLRREWASFLRDQKVNLKTKHGRTGLPSTFVEEIVAWVQTLEPFEEWPLCEALLHCDLHGDHLLVDRSVPGQPRLTGLFDFGDAMIGSREYEFASVATFLFCGAKESMREFFRAYGYRSDELTPSLRARLTGYVLLHRYGPIPLFLNRFTEPRPRSVADLHERLWGF
jgi:hygromycin-B 7''-O-kinase